MTIYTGVLRGTFGFSTVLFNSQNEVNVVLIPELIFSICSAKLWWFIPSGFSVMPRLSVHTSCEQITEAFKPPTPYVYQQFSLLFMFKIPPFPFSFFSCFSSPLNTSYSAGILLHVISGTDTQGFPPLLQPLILQPLIEEKQWNI